MIAHRRRDGIDDVVAMGAREADSVPELVEASDVVILCVTGTPELESMCHRGGLLAAARPGLIVIDCSTSLIADQRVRTYLAHLIDA